MNVPEDLRYTKDHEWVRADGDRFVVGITDFAQQALGDVVFVESPAPDAAVTAGEPCGEIESTKSVSEVFAPVSGQVVEVNGAITDHPEIVNSDPYGQGWIFAIHSEDASVFDSLLSAEAYANLIAEESGS